ncbi:MAG: sulfurtransferase TusA family protein [Planctomycetes bacterium]|nr:sulfurtransferase TusA family protein [Planctomycetota bacterium]
MGARDAPRCLACLASALAAERDAFRDELFAYVQHRECYRVAWAEAGRREGLGPETRPGCLWPADRVGGAGAAGAGNAKAQGPLDASPSRREDAAWDAGELGCGDLVLELRQRLSGMDPGRILRVTARDSGAPEDLPAWCRLTGHILLAATHPDYWIQRRGK